MLVFVGDPGQRIFPERSLRRLKLQGVDVKLSAKGSAQLDDPTEGGGSGVQRSPRLLCSSNVLSSSAGTVKELKSHGSHPFIITPCQDLMEKPNKVGSLADAISVSSEGSDLESSHEEE